MDSEVPVPSSGRPGLAFILLVGLVLVVVSIWFIGLHMDDEKTQSYNMQKQELDAKLKKADDAKRDQNAQQDALRKTSVIGRTSNWKRFSAKNQELLKELSGAEIENQKRLEAEATLIDSSKGAFLVEDDQERAVFTGLKSKFAGVTGQLEQAKISASSYEATSMQMLALDNPQVDVSAEDFAKIVANVEQVRKITVELKAANQYLSKLLAKGSVAASPNTAAATTASLREKIDEDEASRIARNALERQTELQAVREQEELKLRGVLKEQEKARLEKERELVQLQFQIEMQEKEKEIDAAKIAADTKLQSLNQAKLFAEQDKALEAELDRVKSLLAPFITKGRNQFSGGHMVISDKEGPISLSALEGYGALKQDGYGLADLRNAALVVTQQGGRPLGGFSTDIFDRSSAQESQRLLRVHGAALIRAGLLAP